MTGVCNELFLLFCIVQGNISTFSCTDADGIFNGYDEDTSVTDLAGMSSLENGMNGFVHILFADYNGNQDSLNGTGVINHSTVNASLTFFANASYIVIGKPFDFGFEQRVIFSGIAASYPTPAELNGRMVIAVANFAPRKMAKFGVSEGMILSAATADGKLKLLDVDAGAAPGDKVG